MPSISIKIANLPQIKSAFGRAPQLMAEELNKAIKKTMVSIQRETQINVGGSRGINVVTRGLLRAAGRPPIFGDLKSLYEIDIPYGIYVEEGTRYMAARPFLRNAVDTVTPTIDDFFQRAVQNVLDKIGREI